MGILDESYGNVCERRESSRSVHSFLLQKKGREKRKRNGKPSASLISRNLHLGACAVSSAGKSFSMHEFDVIFQCACNG